MKRKYFVLLKPTKYADEVGYTVNVPALRGCITQGDTVEEALEMAREAITGYVLSLGDRELPVPPSDSASKPPIRALSSNMIVTLLDVDIVDDEAAARPKRQRRARKTA